MVIVLPPPLLLLLIAVAAWYRYRPLTCRAAQRAVRKLLVATAAAVVAVAAQTRAIAAVVGAVERKSLRQMNLYQRNLLATDTAGRIVAERRT